MRSLKFKGTSLIYYIRHVLLLTYIDFDLPYSGKLWWWKTLANGQKNELAKKTLANK